MFGIVECLNELTTKEFNSMGSKRISFTIGIDKMSIGTMDDSTLLGGNSVIITTDLVVLFLLGAPYSRLSWSAWEPHPSWTHKVPDSSDAHIIPPNKMHNSHVCKEQRVNATTCSLKNGSMQIIC